MKRRGMFIGVIVLLLALFLLFLLFNSNFNARAVFSPATCSDTDGGLNYYVNGTVTTKSSGTIKRYKDACINSTTLRERYCVIRKSDSILDNKIYSCENGCESGACKEQNQLDMIVILSPQYSSEKRVLDAVEKYSAAIKADINWNLQTVKLAQENNSVGKIRDIIKSYYNRSKIKAALIIGEDIKIAEANEFYNLDLPSIILWEELDREVECAIYTLNDSYPGYWEQRGIEKHLILPNFSAQEVDNLLDAHGKNISIRPQDMWTASRPATKPEVFISLLFPLNNLPYEQKVNQTVLALNKFSNFRKNQSKSNETHIYVSEEVRSYFDFSFINLGNSTLINGSENIRFNFSKNYKSLIFDGHASPSIVTYSDNGVVQVEVPASSLINITTPFILAEGCNIGGWYSNYNPNGYIDAPEASGDKMFMELVLYPNDLRIIMLGLDDVDSSVSYEDFVSYLNSGRTIAEAYLSGNRTLRHIFYGDPTFHY